MKKNLKTIQLIYVIASCIIFTNLRPLLPFEDSSRIIVGGILGALGALTGWLLYKLFEKKNEYIQFIFLGIFFIISILTIRYVRSKTIDESNENPIKSLVDSYSNSLKSQMDKSISRIGSMYKLSPSEYSRLKTCEVCGYIAVLPDSEFCYNCYNGIWESEKGIYNFKNEWLKDMQEIYFEPGSVIDSIDFYKPDTIKTGLNTFIKDLKWKHNVTMQMVKDYRKDKK